MDCVNQHECLTCCYFCCSRRDDKKRKRLKGDEGKVRVKRYIRMNYNDCTEHYQSFEWNRFECIYRFRVKTKTKVTGKMNKTFCGDCSSYWMLRRCCCIHFSRLQDGNSMLTEWEWIQRRETLAMEQRRVSWIMTVAWNIQFVVISNLELL